jgi:hypothetical protein
MSQGLCNFVPRKLDREHAARAGQIAYVHGAATRTDRIPTDGEPEPNSSSVRAPLLERPEQSLGSSVRQSAALVAHLDQDLFRRRVNLKHHAPVWTGELEGVVQEIGHRRGDILTVGFDGETRLDWEYG